jgi:hypothetical protein
VRKTASAGALSRHDTQRASPGLLLWQVANAWQRAVRVAPTPAGWALARRAIAVIEAADDALIATLGGDLPAFGAMFDRLSAAQS